ncbi:MAG TPA: RNA 2',3'-cyclic phosphodiesterase [Anaerolineaceae bacterium]|nr:RNA 2',3'-cyclic phosphodiesterase [Anaerolineaceae bacterium]
MQKRLFIAVDPEPALLDTIFRLISTIKREFPVPGMRYTAPQNLHLTMLFLGDTDENLIPKIENKLDKLCQNFSEFDLEFANLGAFPSRQNPRILWLGVSNPKVVTTLAKAIINDSGLVAEPEKAKFSPHLTLGRVAENARGVSGEMFSKLFAKLGSVNVGSTRIREVLLYQSILKPEGPVYTVLSSHALKNVC